MKTRGRCDEYLHRCIIYMWRLPSCDTSGFVSVGGWVSPGRLLMEDRADYRASRMDNSNYKQDSYYHKDVTCDRITAQVSRLTQIGSTRSSNLWLLGSETSRHLHLTGATLIIYTTQQLINSCCDCWQRNDHFSCLQNAQEVKHMHIQQPQSQVIPVDIYMLDFLKSVIKTLCFMCFTNGAHRATRQQRSLCH